MSTHPEDDGRRLLRCPACNGDEFVQVWDGYVYTTGRLVIDRDVPGEWEFVDWHDMELDEGTIEGWACASCGAPIDPDDANDSA